MEDADMTAKNIPCPVCQGHQLVEENDTWTTCHNCGGTGHIQEEIPDEIYPRLQAKIDAAIAAGEKTIDVRPDDADLMRHAGYARDIEGSRRIAQYGQFRMFVAIPVAPSAHPVRDSDYWWQYDTNNYPRETAVVESAEGKRSSAKFFPMHEPKRGLLTDPTSPAEMQKRALELNRDEKARRVVQICYRYESGVPLTEIEEEFGLSRTSIYKILNETGVRTNRRRDATTVTFSIRNMGAEHKAMLDSLCKREELSQRQMIERLIQNAYQDAD
jgi:hypothetical protein